MQSLTARLPGPVRDLRGSVNANGNFQTRGLAREELAKNLTGQMELRVRDISFGDFDPLGTLAQQSHWGKLEPVRGPVTAPPTNLDMEIRDRRFILKPADGRPERGKLANRRHIRLGRSAEPECAR